MGRGRIIRDQQEKWLQEMVEGGAACPFCNSSSLKLGTKLEVPPLPERGPLTQTREPRPEAFMRVECRNCGYVSLFKSRFPV